MWYNDSQRIPFLLSAAVFAELHKLLCNLTIIFYVESSVLSLTVIVSGVKILSKKEKAFSATDGAVDNHRGTEKAEVTCAVTEADRLGALTLVV